MVSPSKKLAGDKSLDLNEAVAELRKIGLKMKGFGALLGRKQPEEFCRLDQDEVDEGIGLIAESIERQTTRLCRRLDEFATLEEQRQHLKATPSGKARILRTK